MKLSHIFLFAPLSGIAALHFHNPLFLNIFGIYILIQIRVGALTGYKKRYGMYVSLCATSGTLRAAKSNNNDCSMSNLNLI